MKKTLLVLGFLLFLPSVARSQTVTKTLAWNEPDTLADVNAYMVTLVIDSSPPIQLTPTCVAGTPVAPQTVLTSCTSPVTITPGNHTIILTNTNASGSSSGTLNYVAPNAPLQPAGLKVVITITFP